MPLLYFSFCHRTNLRAFVFPPLNLTSLFFFLVVTSFPFSAWSLCRAVLAALCFACVGVVVVVLRCPIAGSTDEFLYPYEFVGLASFLFTESLHLP